jgi:hypothetical protein
MRVQHFYIPPDVTIDDDGNYSNDDLQYVYNLHDMYDRWLMSYTGLGMPPVDYITQRGPEQHGETVLDFRLKERLIQYIHRRDGCTLQGYWDAREDTIDKLRPNRQSQIGQFEDGRLRVIRPDGSVRDILATILSGPVFTARNPAQWDEWAFTEALRFKCADPTWFDPAVNTVTWTVDDVVSGLYFYDAVSRPESLVFPDNAVFANDIISPDPFNVTYTGTWFSYPTFIITGPLRGPAITNTVLDIKIQLEYEVAAGEVVTIVTDYGSKSITNQLNENLINTKSRDSDLNLYIAPHPYASGGVNTFLVSGSGASLTNTSVVMQYRNRYIGI